MADGARAVQATPKRLLGIAPGEAASDGAGVRMTRMLGNRRVQAFDPFLMLDHFDSAEASDYLAGFPDHPHRGFDTVTYMLEGRMRHADNKGHSGVIEPGGIQWMRAARGLVHSEMPEQQSGRMRGFQLWVNLPGAMKMGDPEYQEFGADRIPVETRDDGATVKVIVGETNRGTRGPVQNPVIDARYFDVTLPAGATFREDLPTDHVAMLAVYEGRVAIGGQDVRPLSAAYLGEGERVEAQAGADGARLLLIAGRPIGEPIAWAGPFVMNTREEVQQAFADFQAGRF